MNSSRNRPTVTNGNIFKSADIGDSNSQNLHSFRETKLNRMTIAEKLEFSNVGLKRIPASMAKQSIIKKKTNDSRPTLISQSPINSSKNLSKNSNHEDKVEVNSKILESRKSKSKSPFREKEPPQAKPLAKDSDDQNNSEEMNVLLAKTEEELYQKNEELVLLIRENASLVEENQNLLDQKTTQIMELSNCKNALKEAINSISALADIFENYIKKNNDLYDLTENSRKSISIFETAENRKNPSILVQELRTEAAFIMRRIEQKVWERVEHFVYSKSNDQVELEKSLRREIVRLKTDNNIKDKAIERFEIYSANLERRIENLSDEYTSNKGNIMKILDLTKQLKEQSQKEDELKGIINEMTIRIQEEEKTKAALGFENIKNLQIKISNLEESLSTVTRRNWELLDANARVVKQLNLFEDQVKEMNIKRIIEDQDKISKQEIKHIFNRLFKGDETILQSKFKLEAAEKQLAEELIPEALFLQIELNKRKIDDVESTQSKLLAEFENLKSKCSYYQNCIIELSEVCLNLSKSLDINQIYFLPTEIQLACDKIYQKRLKIRNLYQDLLNNSQQERLTESSLFGFTQMDSAKRSESPTFGNNSLRSTPDSKNLTKESMQLQDSRKKEIFQDDEIISLKLQLKQAKLREENLEKMILEMKNFPSDKKLSKLEQSTYYSPRSKANTSPSLHLNLSPQESAKKIENDVNLFKKLNDQTDFYMFIHMQSKLLESQIAESKRGIVQLYI